MSRRARALPSLPSDAPSVQVIDTATRWRTLFGSEAPHAANFIEQAIAWKEQVLAQGDVAPAIARDLAIAARLAAEARGRKVAVPEPANAAPCSSPVVQHAPNAAPCSEPAVRPSPATPPPAAPRRRSPAPAPLPPASSQLVPGTRLVKMHGGKTHVVEVIVDGFLYEGESFASLSAIARHITGTHWNGLLFFGLRRRKTYPKVRHG